MSALESDMVILEEDRDQTRFEVEHFREELVASMSVRKQ